MDVEVGVKCKCVCLQNGLNRVRVGESANLSQGQTHLLEILLSPEKMS